MQPTLIPKPQLKRYNKATSFQKSYLLPVPHIVSVKIYIYFYQDTTVLTSVVHKNYLQDLALVKTSVVVPSSHSTLKTHTLCIPYRDSHTMASAKELSNQRKSNHHTDSRWLLPTLAYGTYGRLSSRCSPSYIQVC